MPVFHCRVDNDETRDSREVPAWMFDATICEGMRLLDAPHVSIEALVALQRLLVESSCARDEQAQDRLSTDTEGVDEKRKSAKSD